MFPAESFSESPNPIFENLNPEQLRAVETTEGPVLVLAGAGTGKTRVLTTRIAHLILSGRAFPGQILSVTFTNKAAREMLDRVNSLVEHAAGVWLGTFHSMALRILRQHAERLGFKRSFTILDTDDQLRLLKTILAEHNLDEKQWPAKLLLAIIQRLKDQGLTPDKANKAAAPDFAHGKTIQFYEAYQSRLKTLNAMDFGDLLLHCLTLFAAFPEVLEDYQRRFKYILVDEYQDTNVAQYLWLRLLAQKHRNLCCVGDDDQSIYGWRGAEVANILKFEQDFPGAAIIRLEQNYRSTQPILSVASSVIANNRSRHGKTLWTDNKTGPRVKVVAVWDEKNEARYIAGEIEAAQQIHRHPLNEIAILVRAGFQTRAFEECFVALGIPYRVVGGLRFYERQEIRDAVAYLRVIASPDDNLALERIINLPKRGVGDATLEPARQHARAYNIPLYRALEELCAHNEFKPRMQSVLAKLLGDFARWRNMLSLQPHREVVEAVLTESGYLDMWKAEKTIEGQGRVENLKELVNAIGEFESLEAFLEHVSLVSDVDTKQDGQLVTLMTLHASKGLEFETVFLPGWEEGLFPSPRTMEEKGLAGLEEERRLAYVGITRAKRNLTIVSAANRRIYNQWQASVPSRFVDELPKDQVDKVGFNGIQKPEARNLKPEIQDRQLQRQNTKQESSSGFRLQASGFRSGSRVFHEKFGYGVIERSEGSHLTIHFDKAGRKTVLQDFVTPA